MSFDIIKKTLLVITGQPLIKSQCSFSVLWCLVVNDQRRHSETESLSLLHTPPEVFHISVSQLRAPYPPNLKHLRRSSTPRCFCTNFHLPLYSSVVHICSAFPQIRTGNSPVSKGSIQDSCFLSYMHNQCGLSFSCQNGSKTIAMITMEAEPVKTLVCVIQTLRLG